MLPSTYQSKCVAPAAARMCIAMLIDYSLSRYSGRGLGEGLFLRMPVTPMATEPSPCPLPEHWERQFDSRGIVADRSCGSFRTARPQQDGAKVHQAFAGGFAARLDGDRDDPRLVDLELAGLLRLE